MKLKKWIVPLIVFIPPVIWILLELSAINSKKLNYFGPKKVLSAKDTMYHSVGDIAFEDIQHQKISIDTNRFLACVIAFIKPEYKAEKYRIASLIESSKFEPGRLNKLPVILVYPFNTDSTVFNLKDSLQLNIPEIYGYYLPIKQFDAEMNKYFLLKPYYVDYSFAVLVDKKRNIRGYYDLRYADELKRMIKEYQHLKIKESYKVTLQQNKIEKK